MARRFTKGKAAMSVFVVLLRAIGPVTHRIMSMAAWREACRADGFGDPQTYLATGNMIVAGDGTPAQVAARMDRIVAGLGLGPGNRAVVRTPAQLRALVKANPFPDAAIARPSQVGVYFFAEAPPDLGWVADYDGPERLHVEGVHLIVDYGEPIPKSIRLPGLIEKRSGTVTARNWNTLCGLAQRCAARAGGEK